jgi:hypothetical protein
VLRGAALAALPATAPTTAPTTAAATQPEAPLLYKGRLHYTPPPGWQFIPKAATDLTVAYSAPDGLALMTLTLTPQQDAFIPSDTVRRDMARQIVKGLKAALAKKNVQMIVGPHAEPEERAFLKIHLSYHEGQSVSDQTLYYRVVGPELVMAVVGVRAETPEQAKIYQEAALATLLSANLQHAARSSGGAPARESKASRPAGRP